MKKLPRVRVRHDKSRPLPMAIRQDLKRHADALGERLPALDTEIGIYYPPIEVPSIAWTSYDAAGRLMSMPLARFLPLQFGKTYRLAVEVSPAALLAFGGSQLLDGVLAHEFLHYIWTTIHYLKKGSGLIPADSPESLEAENVADYEDYKRKDKALQVSPEEWITERLADLVNRAEASEAAEMRFIQSSMVDTWVKKDLPVEPIDMRFSLKGMLDLDSAVIAKARLVGLLPPES